MQKSNLMFEGKIILADEMSPDTCRFGDLNIGEKVDGYRFRRDLVGEKEAYREFLRRLLDI